MRRIRSTAPDYEYEMDEGDGGRKREAGQDSAPAQKKKRLFIRELKYMMHGFGDDLNPHTETAELVEDLAIDFITEMTLKAMDVGKKGKVHVEDIIYTIRKDAKKYARVKDLLMMNEELKKARKAFDDEVDNI